ncbi:hypothetical protein [Gordonia rubripertincta]|uniref:Uncharacterized protein n=1 Tax=Gordonia rubripertincta TaxID=36822 RepID=A0ABT4MXR9_GORRU|nr:hypothetical protein [Gordonia rubripertincta]MCZ4551813.1 hypothetical protein [Gordonia rubripertincta]
MQSGGGVFDLIERSRKNAAQLSIDGDSAQLVFAQFYATSYRDPSQTVLQTGQKPRSRSELSLIHPLGSRAVPADFTRLRNSGRFELDTPLIEIKRVMKLQTIRNFAGETAVAGIFDET